MGDNDVCWVRHDGRNIAYQVTGSGPATILLLDLWISNLDADWDWPANARVLRRLGSVARLVRFDRSGMGLSDRVPPPPDQAAEVWTGEALAVLDQVGVDRAQLIGGGWCTPLAIALAAQAPDRVDRMVLNGPFARLTATADYPIGMDPDLAAAARALVGERWGSGVLIDVLGLGDGADDRARAAQGRYERSAASRHDIEALAAAFVAIDVRHHLEQVRAPTLATYRDNALVSLDQARHVTDTIPDAELRVLDPREWSWPVADADLPPALLVTLDYLLGRTAGGSDRRRLAAIVFTDIVGSTPLVDRLGDRDWSDLLDQFRRRLQDRVDLWHGRLVNSAGDGFLLVFDAARNATQFALEFTAAVGDLGLQVRTGVHVGECEMHGDDLRGLAVHACARIAALADPDQILLSESAARFTADDVLLIPAGEHHLRGVPGTWPLHKIATH